MTTTGLRMRVKNVRGRIEPQCGALGPGPRSFGPEGPAPSLQSLVAIFNDARRSLVGQTGGFSLAQGRMVLTVLRIAGLRFLPSPRQFRAMGICLGVYGSAKEFDSLLCVQRKGTARR